MKLTNILLAIGLLSGVAFVIFMLLQNWSANRRLAAILKARPQLDDVQFAQKFSSSPTRADIAVRARRVLSANLRTSLLGLALHDRLDADLNASLPLNPDLFWELEKEFKIKTDVDDLDSHEKTLQQLVTFQDLVDYIERKITEPPAPPPVPDPEEQPSRIAHFALRALPFLFVTGFLVMLVGIAKPPLLKVGVAIFLSGAAVWGLANGGEMLRLIIQTVRRASWSELRLSAWGMIAWTLFALFFLWIGATFGLAILKNLRTHN